MKRTAKITTLSLLTIASVSGIVLLAGPSSYVDAHCQVPCGIYGDKLKFEQLEQDIQTIEKSMRLTRELSAEPGKNANQLVRWINNKDLHADKFAEEISYYFLQQRVKLDEAKTDRNAYLKKLELCHQLMVYAMECKSTTDQAKADQLRATLKEFEAAYMGKTAGIAKPEKMDDDHGHDH